MIVVPKKEMLSRLGFLCGSKYIQRLSASTMTCAGSTASTQNESSSVNQGQVEHHSQLAGDWWNPTGFLRALHSMNALRVPFIRDGIMTTTKINPSLVNTACPLTGTKILDVGCGGGFLSEPLARLGAEVTGIDASSQLIDVARSHARLDRRLDNKLNYEVTTAEEHMKTHTNFYDAVVASEVVEHVANQSFFLTQCTEMVQPGGSMFVTTFNKNWLSWLGGIIAAEYIIGSVPKGTHDWNLFISPEDVQKLLEKCNCHTKLVNGMAYIPFENAWIWAPSPIINYALHAVKAETR